VAALALEVADAVCTSSCLYPTRPWAGMDPPMRSAASWWVAPVVIIKLMVSWT